MKKVITFVVAVVIILAFYSIAFAYKGNIAVDGRITNYNFRDITIKIDGKTFDTGSTPPLILNDHTVIPVRAISEGLGAKVDWNEKIKTVTITKDIVIKLTIGSNIAIVDGKQVTLDTPARVIGIANNGYTYIPFRFLFEKFGYKVEWIANNYQINVTSPPPKYVNITDFNTTFNSGVLSINIKADSPIKYTQDILEGSDNSRLYVDIENAILKSINTNIDINKGGITKAIIAQNQPEPKPKVRAVIYLSNMIPYTIIQSQDKMSLSITFNIGTGTVTGINFIKQNNSDELIIKSDAGHFNTFRNGANTIVLDISGSTLNMPDGKLAGQMQVQGNIITSIRYSQYNSDTVRIAVDTNAKAEYSVQTDGKNIIMLVLKSDPNMKPLVYIDPGHGGSDPGAIGVGGLRESDVNLAIALKLNDLLTKGGFRTMMSRDSDVDVGLVDRPEQANNSDANVFVSIHANSFSAPTASGTEVLYYPNGYKGDTRDNLTFAQIIHDNLMKEIQTTDRGLVERPNLAVLNHTKMPAVLVETAFVTNPDDAKLLQDDSFQWKVAQGIYNGIVEYFKKLNDGTISTTVSNAVYQNK